MVIGGGAVAERKAMTLLDAGAAVRVIAPRVTAALRALAAAGRIQRVARRYRPGDLAEAYVVIAATDDGAVNQAVWREAQAAGVLVNAVDDVACSSFIAPALVQRGALTIAVSTGGVAPAYAARVRAALERQYGDECAAFLELMAGLRERIKTTCADPEARKELMYLLVDSEIIDLLRGGDQAAAAALAERIIAGTAQDGERGDT